MHPGAGKRFLRFVAFWCKLCQTGAASQCGAIRIMSPVSIHIALNHQTHYRYDRPVRLGPQIVRLRPAPHCRTRILSYSLKVEPAKHFVNWQQDVHANYLARLNFPEPTESLRVEVDLVAEMSVLNPFDFFLESYAEEYPFAYEAGEAHELAPYLVHSAGGPRLDAYVAELSRARRRSIDFLSRSTSASRVM